MNRKLLALLAGNAKKGSFKAEGNTIMVYDVIVAADADAEWFGGVSAESFVPLLAGLSGDVDIRINSPGGDVFGAKAMAQAIRDYPGQVTVHVDGVAASAATFLTAVADKTVMAPGSMLMIHKAWTFAIGNSDELSALAKVMDKIDGTIADSYAASAAKRGVEPADFAALMAAETWYTPDEAIAAGMADEQAPEKVKAKVDWDLSAYEHPPQTAALAPEQTITVTVTVDTSAIDAALDKVAALAAAAAAAASTNQIEETVRPNLRADLLLRPAA